MKSRTVREIGHVVCMGETRNVHTFGQKAAKENNTWQT
jgi:hypothetical protein